MIFIHVDPTTNNIEVINQYIEKGKELFILFYMEGCGPCNATRPEWSKIKNVIGEKYKKNGNIVVADIDQEMISKMKYFTNPPSGFPTMIYISKKGNQTENYENSSISNKNRSIDSFVDWIQSKVNNIKGGANTKRKFMQLGGRKWSLKYKRSINCKRPKGFSQKQYCRRKNKKYSNRK